MYKKIGFIIIALFITTGIVFAGTEDDPSVKRETKKRTKIVCKNVTSKPQPGPNTIQNFVVKRVCKEVPVQD